MVFAAAFEQQRERKTMLISVKGAQLLDEVGAEKSADYVRRNEPSTTSYFYACHVQNIVRNMLLECTEQGFVRVLKEAGDAVAVLQALKLMHGATEYVEPSFRRSVRRLYDDLRFSYSDLRGNSFIARDCFYLLMMPVLRYQYRRGIGLIKRLNTPWVRQNLIRILLENGNERVLHVTVGMPHLFHRDERKLIMQDSRLGYAV